MRGLKVTSSPACLRTSIQVFIFAGWVIPDFPIFGQSPPAGPRFPFPGRIMIGKRPGGSPPPVSRPNRGSGETGIASGDFRTGLPGGQPPRRFPTRPGPGGSGNRGYPAAPGGLARSGSASALWYPGALCTLPSRN